MEYWEIYNRFRQKTEKVHKRGYPLNDGDYHIVVHIWIRNSSGEYLIQKRAETCSVLPGLWAVTGGSAILGESSKEACLRETKEELGIDLKSPNLAFTLIRHNNFRDVWLAKEDIELGDIKMQAEEVSEVAYATKEEIYELAAQNNFMMQIYLDDIFEIAESPLSIERANATDTRDLYDTYRKSFDRENSYPRGNPPEHNILRKIQQHDYYKIIYNNLIVGGVCVYPKKTPSVFQIDNLFILPEYRKLKIGSQAISRIENIYPQAKKYVLKLSDNDTVSSWFYQKMGYKKINIKRKINDNLVLDYYEKYL